MIKFAKIDNFYGLHPIYTPVYTLYTPGIYTSLRSLAVDGQQHELDQNRETIMFHIVFYSGVNLCGLRVVLKI